MCDCVQDYVVPEGSRKVVRDTMAGLLTCPPPYSVAASTRQAVKQLSEWRNCGCGQHKAWAPHQCRR